MAKQSKTNTNTNDLPSQLREGEKVLIKGRVSEGIFWKSFGVFLIALLLSLLAIQLAIFMGIVALLTFFYALLLKNFLLLIVTNERIFFRSGLIKVDTVQVRLDRVESVEIQRTITGQLLNYGTVVLTGIGSRYSYIPYLANAAEVRNVIDDLLYQKEKKKE
jgi:predicted membrane protein